MKNIKEISYTDARDDIVSGDLLAWSRSPSDKYVSNIFLSIVKYFTKSNIGHVGIALKYGSRLLVVEAAIPLIRIIPVSKRETFYWVPSPIPWNNKYLPKLLSYLGKSYSMVDCFRAYFGKTTKDDNRWQCAELVMDFYKEAGVELNIEAIPNDVVEELVNLNGNEIYHIK